MTALLLLLLPLVSGPQDEVVPSLKVEVAPTALELEVGEKAKLVARVLGEDGQEVDGFDVVFFSRGPTGVAVESDGSVEALRPGEYSVVARVATVSRPRPSVQVPVTVAFPPLERVELFDVPHQLHVGTSTDVRGVLIDAAGLERAEVGVEVSPDTPGSARVDAFGRVTGLGPGTCELVARAEGFEARASFEVIPNPIAAIELTADAEQVRTGDVVRFTAVGRDAAGAEVRGVPIHLSFVAQPDDDLGPGASGQIEPDGRFVAETPGLYTVVATSGNAAAQRSVQASVRDVQRDIVMVGHGEVLDVHTSDLWVWEGVDGRDYAVTGTWGANGDALFWDVTDPSDLQRIAKVTVDARTVNDVKVSADGRLCVISREGASNRKNGIVLIDVVNPREPAIVGVFTDGLTGGVHNLFIYENHVYALSAGRRYDVINIDDPTAPRRVGSFELDTPGHSIHDVWVVDGVAYSSNWDDGVVLVDVGGGGHGGSPENPVQMGSYVYPSGWNHAAFPFTSADTGKFYVVAGDEAFPYGLNLTEKPTYPRGWLHFIDFSDMENPREVARYQVPEAGTHNFWIEGDLLYCAYYNGGLRVIDISGDLMGDLYRQGREVGWYLPTHHESVVPNAPMVWGPQPHKGHVFFSDWNSGLWSAKLEEVEQ